MGKLFVLVVAGFLTALHVSTNGCNLKASEKTFLDEFGVPWSCRNYCPGIRGCMDTCCATEVKIAIRKPEKGSKTKYLWVIAFPVFIVGCLIVLAVWKFLKRQIKNSNEAMEAQEGAVDPMDSVDPNENANERRRDAPSTEENTGLLNEYNTLASENEERSLQATSL